MALFNKKTPPIVTTFESRIDTALSDLDVAQRVGLDYGTDKRCLRASSFGASETLRDVFCAVSMLGLDEPDVRELVSRLGANPEQRVVHALCTMWRMERCSLEHVMAHQDPYLKPKPLHVFSDEAHNLMAQCLAVAWEFGASLTVVDIATRFAVLIHTECAAKDDESIRRGVDALSERYRTALRHVCDDDVRGVIGVELDANSLGFETAVADRVKRHCLARARAEMLGEQAEARDREDG